MNIDEYREAVIKAVPCPFCEAKVNHGCTAPGRFMLGRTTLSLSYVHDDRSALYHDHQPETVETVGRHAAREHQ